MRKNSTMCRSIKVPCRIKLAGLRIAYDAVGRMVIYPQHTAAKATRRIFASLVLLTFMSITASFVNAADVTINVDTTQPHQIWYGFGCTHESQIFGPTDTLTASQRTRFVDMLFNQVRIRTGQIISALEAPAALGVNWFPGLANDNADSQSINWSGFNTFKSDEFKRTVVDLAPSSATADLYPDVRITTKFFSKWMDPIRISNYNQFLDECAEQVLAQIVNFKNTYGREPVYAQLFNEPTSGNMELTSGTDVMITDIVKRCGDRLRANNLNLVKFVVASQETEEKSLATATVILADPIAAKYVGAIGFHTYPYGSQYSYIPNILNNSGKGVPVASRVAIRNQLRDLGKAHGIPVWMTEVSNGYYGNNTPSNLELFDGARGRAIHIHDELLYAEVSAFFGMESGWSNSATILHGGNTPLGQNPDDIIYIDQTNDRVFITGMGRAIGHYSRFINKGAQILTCTSTNSLVQVTAAKNLAANTLALVLINNDSVAHSIAVNLTGMSLAGNVTGEQSTATAYWQPITPFASTGSGYTVTVPALSITSFLASNSSSQVLTSIDVSPTAASVVGGGTQSFTAVAKDQFGIAMATQPAFTWSVSGGGTVNSAGLFTAGTVAGGPFAVTAASGAKSGIAQVTVLNSVPIITSGPSATPNPTQPGVLVNFVALATDPNGLALTYNWNFGDGLGVTAPAPSHAYTAAGSYPVVVTVTNSNGLSVAATTTVVITAGTSAPEITSAISANGIVSSPFSYTITATNSPTSYNASGLPAGLIVNSKTGVISGTPTVSGTSSVIVSATNSGGTATATVTLSIVNSGLIAWWKFDEGTGTTATDATGNGHTGTLINNPAWVDGARGKALKFTPASNNYVSVADFHPPASLTLEAWILPGDNTKIDSIILNKHNSEYDFRINALGQLSGGAGGQFLTDIAFNFYDTANVNKWYHVAYAFDSTSKTHSLYRNGVLVASAANSAAITDQNTPLRIGRHSQYNFGTFLGTIDEVRIYQRALSVTEVLSDYSAERTALPVPAFRTQSGTPVR